MAADQKPRAVAECFVPQGGEDDLVDHPQRFTLRGQPGETTFPLLCPNCGAAAQRRINVAKVFEDSGDDDTSRSFSVVSVAVPFCDPCIARHRSEERVPGTLANLLSSFADAHMFGAVFPGIAALFVAQLVLRDLLKGRFLVALVLLAVGTVFGLIAWFQGVSVWAKSAHLRVPKQTTVTEAFDFSDDVSAPFEPPRFVCTVRDARFARVLEAINQTQLWVPGSPTELADRKRANWKFRVGVVIVAVIAIAGLIDDWFG